MLDRVMLIFKTCFLSLYFVHCGMNVSIQLCLLLYNRHSSSCVLQSWKSLMPSSASSVISWPERGRIIESVSLKSKPSTNSFHLFGLIYWSEKNLSVAFHKPADTNTILQAPGLAVGEKESGRAGRSNWREWALACFHLWNPLPSRQMEKQARASLLEASICWNECVALQSLNAELKHLHGEKTPCVSGYVLESDRETKACGWLDRAYLDAINHHFACVPYNSLTEGNVSIVIILEPSPLPGYFYT